MDTIAKFLLPLIQSAGVASARALARQNEVNTRRRF